MCLNDPKCILIQKCQNRLVHIDIEWQHDNYGFFLPAKTSVVPVLASSLQWPYLTLKPKHGLLSAFQKWDSQPLKWRQVKVCQYALLYLPTFWHKCFGLLPFNAIGGWVLYIYLRPDFNHASCSCKYAKNQNHLDKNMRNTCFLATLY